MVTLGNPCDIATNATFVIFKLFACKGGKMLFFFLSFFTKLDQMSRVGSRGRHPKCRPKKYCCFSIFFPTVSYLNNGSFSNSRGSKNNNFDLGVLTFLLVWLVRCIMGNCRMWGWNLPVYWWTVFEVWKKKSKFQVVATNSFAP